MLCASDVVSDVWLAARFMSPDMLYLSPCVNTSRLISRGISRINPHVARVWRGGSRARKTHARPLFSPSHAFLDASSRERSARRGLPRAPRHSSTPFSLSPSPSPTPSVPLLCALVRERERERERHELSRVPLAGSGFWLLGSPGCCVRRRPTPTSDYTLLSFHIEQLTVAAAARNGETRNISPRSARFVAMATRRSFSPHPGLIAVRICLQSTFRAFREGS